MKSFIFALLMLLSISIFVTFNALQTVSCIDDMLALTEALPKSAEEFETVSEEAERTMNELTQLWERCFPLISFTAGYANTNRCDEAVGALSIHLKNNNGTDFAVALSELQDSLARLRILEGFHWQGIF